MKVLVDTCIWSYAFRRNIIENQYAAYTKELKELIKESRVEMIGSVRQEVLSGIKHQEQFFKLKTKLSAFPDLLLTHSDYELAAELFNQLRSRGAQGSNTDFLICAVSINHELSIYTDDGDFEQFRETIPIHMHVIR